MTTDERIASVAYLILFGIIVYAAAILAFTDP